MSTQAISAGFSGRHGSDSAAVMAESTARALALRRGRSRGGGPAQAIGHGACGNRMSRAQSRAQQANAVRAGELRTQARKSRLTEETVPIIESRMLRRLPCHPPIARPRGRSACARRKRGGKLCRRRRLVRRRCGRRDTRPCGGGGGGVGVSLSCDGGGRGGVGGRARAVVLRSPGRTPVRRRLERRRRQRLRRRRRGRKEREGVPWEGGMEGERPGLWRGERRRGEGVGREKGAEGGRGGERGERGELSPIVQEMEGGEVAMCR